MIEEYKFGSITIDKKTYHQDVEVYWSGEVLKWWRVKSHTIDTADTERAVGQNPDTIIIGTGQAGMARVTQRCQNSIEQKGIKLIIDKTEQSVKTFNIILAESQREEGKQEKVIGLFHLTC